MPKHVPGQIAADGSFPLELRRTKPYGYSLFNLEAMAGICQTLSTPEDSLWKFELPDGRSMRKAMEYMVPFIEDKKRWTKPADVMYFDQWPVRQASLLFAGLALNKPEYIALWRKLNPDPTVEETVRNLSDPPAGAVGLKKTMKDSVSRRYFFYGSLGCRVRRRLSGDLDNQS